MILTFVQLIAGVAILHQPCPAYLPQHFSCYYPNPGMGRIYLTPEDDSIYTELHEYGHADDFKRLTPSDRRRFKRIMGYKPTRRWWDEKYSFRDNKADSPAPGEMYAENFMACALDLKWRIPKFCALLPPSHYALWNPVAHMTIARIGKEWAK